MKILAFAGSARADSFNCRLLSIATEMLNDQGITVDSFDFKQFPLPIYDGDLEQQSGLPENAKRFKQALQAHDGFVIASPEYNSAYSPLLKNAIDWASRSETADEAPLTAFSGKTAVLLSTSPGALGGLRGLSVLRMLLTNIIVHVLPRQLAVGRAHEAFTDHDRFADETQSNNLSSLMTEFANFTGRLAQ